MVSGRAGEQVAVTVRPHNLTPSKGLLRESHHRPSQNNRKDTP